MCMIEFLKQTWHIAVEAAPWLLLGLVAAGLIYGFVPTDKLTRWLGGRGIGGVLRAAVIGAPLPLCSCGVIPAAVSLRRRGASPGSTVSFLVATPETGVDSVAISYAMLGPVMTVVRPVAAVISAVVAGVVAQFTARGHEKHEEKTMPLPIGPGAQNANEKTQEQNEGCCAGVVQAEPEPKRCCEREAASDAQDESCCSEPTETSCCGTGGSSNSAEQTPRTVRGKLAMGMRYAASNMVDDLGLWIIAGVVLAGAAATFFDPQSLGAWSNSVWTMLAMAVIGVPMYICATASTPLAAGLLVAGLSPGTVLVFLLAGPATNMATLGIVRRELGTATVIGYVVSIGATAIGLGLLTDLLVNMMGWSVQAQALQAAHIVPKPIAIACLVLLVLLAIRPLRRKVIGA